jgi:hypothetical protein
MATVSKTPKVRLVRVSLLATTLAVLALMVHSLSANVYYKSNLIRLQAAANIAVNAGARYLPSHPQSAVQVANSYAKANGVDAAEIELVEVSPDGSTLRIRLRRSIPLYIEAFAIELPGNPIRVTASAHARATTGRFLSISWTNRHWPLRSLEPDLGRAPGLPVLAH